MQVQESILKGMLKNISDPGLRETYGNIISGRYAYRVHCLAPGTNPATGKPFHKPDMPIGFISQKGKVIDACAVNKKGVPIAGIETSRDRFDGRKGFRCYCGNWSIQSEEEQGVLQTTKTPGGVAPTQKDLVAIAEALQKSNKGALSFINGRAEYDGFALEEVTA